MKKLALFAMSLLTSVASMSIGFAAPAHAKGCVAYNDDMAWVMRKESSGNPNANNPNSSAYGCYQLLSGTAKAYGGYSAAAAHRYVLDRYGSWAAARRFHQRNGYY